jgi:hypothetical protein
MREQFLIIGIVVAFGVGFLVGNMAKEVAAPLPVNYDPARQVCMDALKVQKDNGDRCWAQIVAMLGQRATTH